MGPRVPGTDAHDRLVRLLEGRLRACTREAMVQGFAVAFRGASLHCSNVMGVFRARAGEGGKAPLLLCTRYDTRMRADRERDPDRRECPIPGANDGGSGTAVFLHMLPRLARESLARDVALAFLDAEDLGNMDGKEFALGSAWLADHPCAGFSPAEVVALDMVGGKGMIFDIDAPTIDHEPSRKLAAKLFRIGGAKGWEPFVRDKPHRLKYIISDHAPFQRKGIAACILIDIDYPQWHTQEDLPEAMSAASLGITEEALWLFLSQPPG